MFCRSCRESADVRDVPAPAVALEGHGVLKLPARRERLHHLAVGVIYDFTSGYFVEGSDRDRVPLLEKSFTRSPT